MGSSGYNNPAPFSKGHDKLHNARSPDFYPHPIGESLFEASTSVSLHWTGETKLEFLIRSQSTLAYMCRWRPQCHSDVSGVPLNSPEQICTDLSFRRVSRPLCIVNVFYKVEQGATFYCCMEGRCFSAQSGV